MKYRQCSIKLNPLYNSSNSDILFNRGSYMTEKKIMALLMSILLTAAFFSCRKKNQLAPKVVKAIEVHKQIIKIQEKMDCMNSDDEIKLEDFEQQLSSCQSEYELLLNNFTEVEQKQFEEEISKLGK